MYHNVKKSCMAKMTPSRKLHLDKLVNYMYGGLSHTFKVHQEKNMQLMEKERDNVNQSINFAYENVGFRRTLKERKEKLKQSVLNISQAHRNCLNFDDIYYSWETISIYREDYSTFDLVIKDYKAMMCLLHFLHKHLWKQDESRHHFMRSYKIMKLKMKVTYEAWRREIEIGTLLHYAILKSMQKR